MPIQGVRMSLVLAHRVLRILEPGPQDLNDPWVWTTGSRGSFGLNQRILRNLASGPLYLEDPRSKDLGYSSYRKNVGCKQLSDPLHRSQTGVSNPGMGVQNQVNLEITIYIIKICLHYTPLSYIV